jgi:serine/threonine-protein kinase
VTATSPSREFLALERATKDRFLIEREIGRGGMGAVFLARDLALDRPVAIKVLPTDLALIPKLRLRFIREAQTAARLSHPNIVPIHSVEDRGDLVFFVMGFVQGESLADRLARVGPLEIEAAIRILKEVGWALSYAHGQGVVHRDVKPDNVLLEDITGRALVTDFGIAKAVEAPGMTNQGEIVGTIRYMSPEQAAGDPVDRRSDLFSLGVTAFQMLVGRTPFDGASAAAIMAAHLSETPIPIATLRPDIPPRLAAAIDRCLAKDPDARFATGEELVDAVASVASLTLEVPETIRRVHREVDALIGDLGGLGLLMVLTLLAAKLPGSDDFSGIFWGLLEYALLTVAASLLALRVGSVVWQARRVLHEGYRPRELLNAPWITPAQAPRVARRWVQWLIGVLGIAACVLGLVLQEGWNVPGPIESLLDLTLVVAPILLGRWLIHEVMGSGRHLGALRRWLLRVAVRIGSFRARSSNRTAPQSEPTEVLLHHAATGLFSALPKPFQEQLADLPDLVTRIDAAAQRLRQREEELLAALAQAGATPRGQAPVRGENDDRRQALIGDLEATRQRIRQQLTNALSALEGLRIGLLRLSAGIGKPDDITPDLEAARELGERIRMLLEAGDEVESVGHTGQGQGRSGSVPIATLGNKER